MRTKQQRTTDRGERIARRDRAAALRRQVQAGLTIAALGLTGAVAGWLDGGAAAEADTAAASIPDAQPATATPAPKRTLYVVVRQAPPDTPPAGPAAPVARSSGGRSGSSSGADPGPRAAPPPRPAAQPPVTTSSGS